MSHSQAGSRMAVMAAGMHLSLEFGPKAFFIGDVVHILGFGDVKRIDIKAKCCHRARTAGFQNRGTPSIALTGTNRLLGNSEFNCLALSSFDFGFGPSHYKVRVNNSFTEKDFIAELVKSLGDDGCSPEFGPAGFRIFVKRAAEADHLFSVVFQIFKHGFSLV